MSRSGNRQTLRTTTTAPMFPTQPTSVHARLLLLLLTLLLLTPETLAQFRPLGTYGHTATLIGTSIYFYGGQQRTGSNNVVSTAHYFSLDVSRSFDSSNAAWTNYTVNVNADGTTVPPTNAFHTAAAVGSKLYVYGGVVPTVNSAQPLVEDTPVLWVYDTNRADWSAPRMSATSTAPFRWRELTSVATASGQILLFGGKFDPYTGSTNGTFFSHGLYSIDPKSLQFADRTPEGSTPGPTFRATHTASILSDGRVVIIGGRTNDQKLVAMSEIWVYDPAADTWRVLTAGGNAPVPRCAHSAAVTGNDSIIIYGGASDFNVTQAIGDVAVLNTANWKWSKPTVANELPSRFGHTATMVGSDMIVAFGNNPDTGADNSIHILDTLSWSFTTTFDPTRANEALGASAPDIEGTEQSKQSGRLMAAIVGGTLGAAAAVALAVGGFLGYKRYNRRIQLQDPETAKMIGSPEVSEKQGLAMLDIADPSPPEYYAAGGRGLTSVGTVERVPTHMYSSRMALEDPEEMFQTMDIQTFAVPRGKLRVVNE